MYRKNAAEWAKHADFELLDLILLELAFVLSFFLRHGSFSALVSPLYTLYGVCLLIAHVVTVLIFHNYKSILQRGKWIELRFVIKHVAITEILAIVLMYLTHDSSDFSRIIFLLNAFFGIVFCYLEHLFWKDMIRKRVKNDPNKKALIVFTTPERLDRIVRGLTEKKYRGYQISAIAFFDDTEADQSRTYRVPVFFDRESTLDHISHNVVDEAYIDFQGQEMNENIRGLVETLLDAGIVTHLGVGSLAGALPNGQITKFHDLLALTGTISVANSWELALKRIIDVIGGAVGLIATGILCLFVVPAIKTADPGPVFFRQERVGKGGRIFKIVKFRSMYQDAEERKKELMEQNEMQGLMFKMDNDPRIIGSEKGPGKGIGNFIRRTSIDEFPQFWNVLKGDMSLVGTRPPTVEEFRQYKSYHKARLAMRPGITGLWQVSGRSNITDFDEIVALDTEYIKNWNLGQDIKILFKTLKVLANGDGAK